MSRFSTVFHDVGYVSPGSSCAALFVQNIVATDKNLSVSCPFFLFQTEKTKFADVFFAQKNRERSETLDIQKKAVAWWHLDVSGRSHHASYYQESGVSRCL